MPVTAGIVGDAERLTILALLDMAAQPSSPAHLDHTHHPAFDPAEMDVMSLAIVFSMAAKDIRHLQSRHIAVVSSA